LAISASFTLLFYDNGSGCLEHTALTAIVTHTTIFGLTVSTGIGLLIFCGAAGKSGQVPLHVWLPDAMEGPTPVSALIHAATMVAAGVFLIARIFPIMSAHAPLVVAQPLGARLAVVHAVSVLALTPTVALQVVTWIGAITALFVALIAVAQYDIKRILAYSTVSQLGYMMMGLGVGGVAVGMFHLITHAFFKSLLFLGAGSVIHGCSGEQDIRRMGGLRRFMPITFATYAAGMLALCGFPLFFSGFWSKDEILHAAFAWSVSRTPFYFGAIGALLTAFYMTRQVCYMFAGQSRLSASSKSSAHGTQASGTHAPDPHCTPHESPAVMTIPLVILAAFTLFLGLLGAPSWPWLQSFLGGEHATFNLAAFSGVYALMIASSCLVFLGLGLGWWLYGRKPIAGAEAPDALGQIQPQTFWVLEHAFFVDRLYGATIVRLNAFWARLCAWLDRWVWNGVVQTFSYLVLALAWLDNFFDTRVVNAGFDEGCETVARSSKVLSLLQGGRIQGYLQMIGLGLIVLAILMLWRAKA
jgi:NADH-quinone oxidoreductase subunit L